MKDELNVSNEAFDMRPVDTAHPMFEAIWQAIKGWDIARTAGAGYSGATGSDVQVIIDALLAQPEAADRGLRTKRREAAVTLLLSQGWKWDGDTWTKPEAAAPLSEFMVIERHWLQNITSASCLLEQSGSILDQREGDALRKLVASARPAPKPEAAGALAGEGADCAKELCEAVSDLQHGGTCRVWQHGAEEVRCECGLFGAKMLAAALAHALSAAPARAQQPAVVGDEVAVVDRPLPARVKDVLWRIENEAEQFTDANGLRYLRYLAGLLAGSEALTPAATPVPVGGEAFGCLLVEEASCVPHVHPEYGTGLFFTEDAIMSSAPAHQGPVVDEATLIDIAMGVLNDNNGKIGKRRFRADATAVVRRVMKTIAHQPQDGRKGETA